MLKEQFLEKLSVFYFQISDVKTKYRRFKGLLCEFIDSVTNDEKIGFANRYTRIRHIYDKYDTITPEVKSAIHAFETHTTKVLGKRMQISAEEVKTDATAIARLIIAVTGEVPVGEFADIVNNTVLPEAKAYQKRERLSKVRIIVNELTETHLCGYEAGDDSNRYIRARHGVKGVNDLMAVTPNNFRKGAIVNLIDCAVESNGDLTPQLFILYPDYLLDCSSLAESCNENMMSPFSYLYNKVKKSTVTRHILLGDMANYYHDAFVYNGRDVEFKKTTNDAFCTMPIELTACKDLEKPLSTKETNNFFDEALSQFNNIGNVVNNVFPTLGIDKSCATLEPMFICEDIGMQGRLDFLQRKDGNNIVIELKSGKGPFMSNDGVCMNHRSQAFLYQIMVQKILGIPFHELGTYIFYSKYSVNTLRKTYPSMDALRVILNLRNRIVSMEYELASVTTAQATKKIFDYVHPKYIINNYEKNRTSILFRDYIIPQIEEFRMKMATLPPLDQKYIYSFANFICREQLYSKVGGGMIADNIGGFAACWNSSLDEKMESGAILFDLVITGKEEGPNGIDRVTFKFSSLHRDYIANFRKGDMAILYVRNTDEDLVTNKEVLKCSIAELTDGEVTVALRQAQKNQTALDPRNKYAIEPDSSDSANALLRSTFALADTDANRRDIILGKTLPTSRPATLKTEIQDENVKRIVTKAKGADDYFLLVGPPGTGKTSVTLRDMVREFHAEGNNILLLAYTNRAVDEICASVKSAGLDFIRIGGTLNCAPEYHDNIIYNRIRECKDRRSVEKIIKDTRIYIATTTTMNRRSPLFDIVTFDVAIIDEASQILEPQICGILSYLNCNCELAIKKFIMIGDHKQLPAVVVQSENESRVPEEDSDLYEIGLRDRRNSLFERLFSLNRMAGNESAFDMLTHQGRMHRDVAQFANEMFYAGRLKCVPLDHQECELDYRDYNANDPFESMIATKRIAFLPSSTSKDLDNIKTNPNEADIVVSIVIKAMALMEANGIPFTEKSIGVITTYRSQIALIRSKLEQYRIDTSKITIDTVERYQGSQRDIIIYSVCANEDRQMRQICNIMQEDGAFIDRKLNVALTRARKQMFITGCREILMKNNIYAKLINFINRK